MPISAPTVLRRSPEYENIPAPHRPGTNPPIVDPANTPIQMVVLRSMEMLHPIVPFRSSGVDYSHLPTMDQETKDYLDAKFAGIDDKERRVEEFYRAGMARQARWKKRLIPLVLGTLVFMLAFQALLFWYLGLWG